MIHIKLPFRTPNVNNLYWHKGNIKFMKNEAKKLREQIVEICKEHKEYAQLLKDKELCVNVWITENWYNKDGSIKKMDVANREKFLIDSIFKALEIDDRLIFEINLEKIQSHNIEEAIIQISRYYNVERTIKIEQTLN